jgi:peptidoglycan/xylan/chitin deacetylase (PgdA/CDA1 family)
MAFTEALLRLINEGRAKCRQLSTGERLGCGAIGLAVPLFFVAPRLAAIPLAGYLLMCLAAPFIPGSSFFLPVISRGSSGRRAVALTFDDGPDPLTTPELLSLLGKHGVTATFFVNGGRAARHPGLTAEILSRGHTLGNHSYSHDLLGAFRGARAMAREIESTQAVLRAAGVTALAYRPPMGITVPRLARLMEAKGMFVVNFSCRAREGGNRWIRNLSGRILERLRADDIVLLHDLPPTPPSLLPYWLNEVDLILKGIRDRGLEVLPLADLIGKTVMRAEFGIRNSEGGKRETSF